MKKAIQFIFHHKIIAIIVSLVTIGLISSTIIFLNRDNNDKNTTKQPNLNTQEETPNLSEEQDNNQEQEEDIKEEQEDNNTTSDTPSNNTTKPNTNNSTQNDNTTTGDNTTKPNTSDDTQNNNTTKPNTENNTTSDEVNNNTQDNQETEKAILCDAWDDINIIYPNQSFITNDYDYYVFDTESLYSNNQNCKKLNPEGVKIIRCLDDSCMDENNNIYRYNSYYTSFTKLDNPSQEVKGWFQDETLTIQEGSMGIRNLLRNDGKIYHMSYETTIEGKLLDTIEVNGEKIISFFGGTNEYLPNILKTNKAFYVYNRFITNEEECNKYKDVVCEYDYEYIKEPTLNKNYSEIVWVNNQLYITKDKKIHYQTFFLG